MSPEKLFELVNGLIIAVSRLLWPLIALLAVLLFREDIRGVLRRLRKGKLFGQEMELDPAVEQFREAVERAQVEAAPQLPPPVTTNPELPPVSVRMVAESDVSGILDAAESSPEVSIMKLAAVLDRETRLLLGSLGLLPQDSHLAAPRALDLLTSKGYVPKSTTDALRIFWSLRNKIVHGHTPPGHREVLAVLDIGLSLLRTLRSIPHEINYVFNPGVPVYADFNCQQQRSGVLGLILETHSPGGTLITKRIYPTTKAGYYGKAKRVTWEWSFANTWNETWYRDLDTGEPSEAWKSSAEFVGRHVDEL